VGTCQITYPRCFRQPASLSPSTTYTRHPSSAEMITPPVFTRALPKKLEGRIGTDCRATGRARRRRRRLTGSFESSLLLVGKSKKNQSTTPKRGGHNAGRTVATRSAVLAKQHRFRSCAPRPDFAPRESRKTVGKNWSLMYDRTEILIAKFLHYFPYLSHIFLRDFI